jgi:hypothetical protein
MSWHAAIEALRAELRAAHGQVDDATTIGVALGGLAVLSALARSVTPEQPATPGNGASVPEIDTARIGQMVLADIVAAEQCAQCGDPLAPACQSRHTATAAPPKTPEPPQCPPPAAVADLPADDAPVPSSAQAPLPAAEPHVKLPVWTAERKALLAELWPKMLPMQDVLARLNALPGHPVGSIDAVRIKAQKLGLRRPARRSLSEERRQKLREAIASVRQMRQARGYKVARRVLKDGTVREYRYPTKRRTARHEPEEAAVTMPEMPQESASAMSPTPPEPADDTSEPMGDMVLVPPAEHPLKERVRTAMRRKVTDWAIWASQHGIPLREVYRLRGEIVREQIDAAP